MLKGTINIFKTILTVGKHLFKRPVTLEYPERKNIMPENFRGLPVMSGCVKCGTCLKVCPSGAIKFEEDNLIIDLKKCIFCGNCAFYCPCGAIKMSENYELAVYDKNDLKLSYKIEKRRENV